MKKFQETIKKLNRKNIKDHKKKQVYKINNKKRETETSKKDINFNGNN